MRLRLKENLMLVSDPNLVTIVTEVYSQDQVLKDMTTEETSHEMTKEMTGETTDTTKEKIIEAVT